MRSIRLSRDEYEQLLALIDDRMCDLKDEIRHTDRFQYRQMLKDKEEMFLMIRAKMSDLPISDLVDPVILQS